MIFKLTLDVYIKTFHNICKNETGKEDIYWTIIPLFTRMNKTSYFRFVDLGNISKGVGDMLCYVYLPNGWFSDSI